VVIRSTECNRRCPPRTARHAIRTPDQGLRRNERYIMQLRRLIIQLRAGTGKKRVNADLKVRRPTKEIER